MLPVAWRAGDNPLDLESLHTWAVNVPVRDGQVTRAELLVTPEADVQGIRVNLSVTLFIQVYYN